jgi:hypothetical protein
MLAIANLASRKANRSPMQPRTWALTNGRKAYLQLNGGYKMSMITAIFVTSALID